MFANSSCGAAERFEHLLFTFGFRLLMCDCLRSLAVDRLQGYYVIAPEADYRTDEQRLDSAALADLATDFARDPVIRRPLHQAKCLSGALFGEDVEVG